MFTHNVRQKLRADYGIVIPHELLVHFVQSRRKLGDAATVAFLIANEWQRGLSCTPLEDA